MSTFSIRPVHHYPHGSCTPAGSVRDWRITERRYFGHAVPRFAPFGWVEPFSLTPAVAPIESKWHTERHALNVLNSLNREHDRLWSLSGREAKAKRTGEIFTHPRADSLYVSVDQTCAVGGSRSGESPLWHRVTLLTTTRDGVRRMEDIVIERFPRL